MVLEMEVVILKHNFRRETSSSFRRFLLYAIFMFIEKGKKQEKINQMQLL